MNKNTIEKFKKYLLSRGAEILSNTNKYELIRFRTSNNTHVVYINKYGNISGFSNEAEEAYSSFLSKKNWFPSERHKSDVSYYNKNRKKLLDAIIIRDGKSCIYCDKELLEADMTVEHFLPVVAGGKSHLSNLAIACSACNNYASHLSIAEKIKIRDKIKRGDVKNDF